MLDEMEIQIAKKCARDQRAIRPIFDRWIVEVDPDVDELGLPGEMAVNDYPSHTTTFMKGAFLGGLYGTGGHELRHNFARNQALFLPIREEYFRENMLDHDLSRFPNERDADFWSDRFWNTDCGCADK
jgi:hypothetical protein